MALRSKCNIGEVYCGTFQYFDKNGERQFEDFYIHTCDVDWKNEDVDPRTRAHRVNDMNEQLNDTWQRLLAEGCTQIKYTEYTMNGIFA